MLVNWFYLKLLRICDPACIWHIAEFSLFVWEWPVSPQICIFPFSYLKMYYLKNKFLLSLCIPSWGFFYHPSVMVLWNGVKIRNNRSQIHLNQKEIILSYFFEMCKLWASNFLTTGKKRFEGVPLLIRDCASKCRLLWMLGNARVSFLGLFPLRN